MQRAKNAMRVFAEHPSTSATNIKHVARALPAIAKNVAPYYKNKREQDVFYNQMVSSLKEGHFGDASIMLDKLGRTYLYKLTEEEKEVLLRALFSKNGPRIQFLDKLVSRGLVLNDLSHYAYIAIPTLRSYRMTPNENRALYNHSKKANAKIHSDNVARNILYIRRHQHQSLRNGRSYPFTTKALNNVFDYVRREHERTYTPPKRLRGKLRQNHKQRHLTTTIRRIINKNGPENMEYGGTFGAESVNFGNTELIRRLHNAGYPFDQYHIQGALTGINTTGNIAQRRVNSIRTLLQLGISTDGGYMDEMVKFTGDQAAFIKELLDIGYDFSERGFEKLIMKATHPTLPEAHRRDIADIIKTIIEKEAYYTGDYTIQDILVKMLKHAPKLCNDPQGFHLFLKLIKLTLQRGATMTQSAQRYYTKLPAKCRNQWTVFFAS